MLYCISTPFMIVNRTGERGPMKVWIRTQKEEFKVESFTVQSKELPEVQETADPISEWKESGTVVQAL